MLRREEIERRVQNRHLKHKNKARSVTDKFFDGGIKDMFSMLRRSLTDKGKLGKVIS